MAVITTAERGDIPKKTCTVVFVIDTSESMAGARIGAVNSAIEETLKKFKEMNVENADAEIEVAILAFSSGARWITPVPTKPENHYSSNLDAGGKRDMGEAFSMLEDKLRLKRQHGFMKRSSDSYAPFIALISDGKPTDDYQEYLSKLRSNLWFQQSIRVAIAVGDEADDAVLEKFTGSKEAVIRIAAGQSVSSKLTKMFVFVAVQDELIAQFTTVEEENECCAKYAEVFGTDFDYYSHDEWDIDSFVSTKNLNPKDDSMVGTVIQDSCSRSVKILEEVGRGGDGVVYEVELDGKQMAMKWYSKNRKWKKCWGFNFRCRW